MNRKILVMAFASLPACTPSCERTTRCDFPLPSIAIPTALEAYGDGSVYVAATWFRRDDSRSCSVGEIGAAIYRLQLDGGPVEQVDLPAWTGAGGTTSSEFLVFLGTPGLVPSRMVSGLTPRLLSGDTLLRVPGSSPLSFQETALPENASAITGSDGRAYLVVPGALLALGPGVGATTSTPLDNSPIGASVAFGRVWVSGEDGDVVQIEPISLSVLATNPACPSTGSIAPVGRFIVVQCEAGGLAALSATSGSLVVTLDTATGFHAIGGSETNELGFVSVFEGEGETVLFTATSGVLSMDPIFGWLEDDPIYRGDEAIIVTSGVARRVTLPAGETSSFPSALSDAAQIELTSDDRLLIAAGRESDYELLLHVLDPTTGEPLQDPISLPPPQSFFHEE